MDTITLRMLRIRSSLSQTQLADILNIKPRTISKWEHFEGLPDIAQAVALCQILDCSMSELLQSLGLQINGIRLQ